MFELYAGAKAQLEIEFFNEVGTGTLGVTLDPAVWFSLLMLASRV